MSEGYVPSSLQFFLKRIQGFSRMQYRSTPNGNSQTASPGDTISFFFPNATVDLDTFVVSWRSTISTTASWVPASEQHISRLEIISGGKTIESISNYGTVFKMLLDYTSSTPHTENRYITSNGPRATFSLVNDVLTTATDATLEAAATISAGSAAALSGVNIRRYEPHKASASGTLDMSCTSWLGFLANAQPRMFAADLLPGPTELRLTLYGNEILDGDGGTDSTWALSNIHSTYDVIKFPDYQSSLLSALSAGAPLTYGFVSYSTYSYASPAANAEHSFSIATTSLRRVYLVRRDTGYATQQNGHDASASSTNPFVHTQDSITSAQLQVDGQLYPSYVQQLDRHGFAYALQSLGVLGDSTYDCMVQSQNDYNLRSFMWVYSFCHNTGDAREVSGYNTNGLSSQMLLRLTGGSGGAHMDVITCEYNKFLEINPGRVINVYQ